ncbi:MAG: tetratricopeptide repeat protein [Planctomycetota bacterium]
MADKSDAQKTTFAEAAKIKSDYKERAAKEREDAIAARKYGRKETNPTGPGGKITGYPVTPYRPEQGFFYHIPTLLNEKGSQMTPEIAGRIRAFFDSDKSRVNIWMDDRVWRNIVSKSDLKNVIKDLWIVPPPNRHTSPKSESDVSYREEESKTTAVQYDKRLTGFYSIAIEHFFNQRGSFSRQKNKEAVEEILNVVFGDPLDEKSQNKGDGKSWDELLKGLEKAVAEEEGLGREPLIMLCRGRICKWRGEPELAKRFLTEAVIEFRRNNYPSRVVLLPVIDLNWNLPTSSAYQNQKKYYLSLYYQTLTYWLENDFDVEPKDHRFAAVIINSFIDFCDDNEHYELCDQFYDFFVQQTHLPKWIRSYIRGEYLLDLGWRYRGTGVASTVDNEGWEKFQKYLTEAKGFFEEAIEINPFFPEPAKVMCTISQAGHGDKSEQYWFEQSILGQPDYFGAHSTRLYSLYPQWGGSAEEMIEFARSRSGEELYNTMAPLILLECYDTLQKLNTVDEAKRKKISSDPELTKDVIDAIDGVLNNNEEYILGYSTVDREYLLTIKSIVAYNGKHYDICSRTLDELGDDIDYEAMTFISEFNSTGLRLKILSAVKSGEKSGPDFEQLMAKIVGRSANEIELDELKTIRNESKSFANKYRSEPLKSKAFAMIGNNLDILARYQSGEKVQLDFDPDLLNWSFSDFSQIAYESPTAVKIDTTSGPMEFRLSSSVDFPFGDFRTIEFDLEVLEDKNWSADAAFFTPSAIFAKKFKHAYSVGLSRSYLAVNLRPKYYRQSGLISFGYYYLDQPLEIFKDHVNVKVNHFKVNLGPGYYEVYLNNKFIFRSKNPKFDGPIDRFIFGTPASRKSRGIARLSDITFQKWEDQSPPVFGSADELVEHYEKVTKRNSTDLWSQFWLAQAYHKQGNFDKAIGAYKKATQLGVPKNISGFFLGDCYELTGKLEAAQKCYFAASGLKDENKKIYALLGQKREQYTNGCHWAAYRLNWLALVSGDQSLLDQVNQFEMVEPLMPSKNVWANNLLKSLQQAQNGDFAAAAETAKAQLPQCSVEQEEIVLEMIRCFKSNQPYRPGNSQPFYQTFAESVPLFRTVETLYKNKDELNQKDSQ